MINMSDITSVSKDSAEISYVLYNDEKATTIYKKVRTWVSLLADCEDFSDFQMLVKKMKPSEDFIIKGINFLDEENNFWIRIGTLFAEDENDYEEDENDAGE